MALISGEMTAVVLVGITVGMAGAWVLARALESLVYGVQVHDVSTFLIVPIAMLTPTLLATLLPARRAMRVNPAQVMRAE